MKYAIVSLEPPGYQHGAVFKETIDCLMYGFQSLGHDCVLTKDLNLDRQYIVFGAIHARHGRMALPKDCIIYNLEQINTQSGCGGPDYVNVLKQAKEIWDFSLKNIENLEKLGLSAKYLPPGFAPCLENHICAPKTTDVLFIGTNTNRRNRVFKMLKSGGLPVSMRFGLYGEQRDLAVREAKIVLNLRSYDLNSLETIRLTHLLANSTCVVSESAPGEQEEWSPGVRFCETGKLIETCRELLADDEARDALAQAGQKLIRGRPIEAYLKDVLKS